MTGFKISPAGCHVACAHALSARARTPWWRILRRRRLLQSAQYWAEIAGLQSMKAVSSEFDRVAVAIRRVAGNPSDSEIAGPR